MKKIDKRKIFLVIIIILILIVIALFIGKFTFSYLAPDISEDINSKGEVTASGDTIIFNNGKALTLSATTDNFTTGGTNLTSTTNPTAKLVASSKTNKADATYYVGVHIKNNTYTYSTTAKTPEIILTIKDEKGSNVTSVDGLTYKTSGGVSGFDVTDKTGLFNIKTDYPITTTSSTTGTTHTWTFTLTFVNLSTDQSVNENANMNLDVYLQKKAFPSTVADVCSGGETLASCVTTLSQKSISQATNIYHHDSTLANGAGDNSYRYSGVNPNNYVCFGSNVTPCPADNLYRIIGVFDNKVGENQTEQRVKLIKSTSVGKMKWDSNGSNTWSTSSLNSYLNNDFLNAFDETTKGKIADTTWKVGGFNSSEQPASIVYQNEINSSPSETKKIGLMYASDYMYAAPQDKWTLVGYNSDASKDYRAATSVNWMYLGATEWTISRSAGNSSYTFGVNGAGGVSGSDVDGNAYVVRPVFYLISSVNYASGSGTAADPILVN